MSSSIDGRTDPEWSEWLMRKEEIRQTFFGHTLQEIEKAVERLWVLEIKRAQSLEERVAIQLAEASELPF